MKSDNTAVATRHLLGGRRPAVHFDPESFPPLREGPTGRRRGGRRGSEPAIEGGAAKHLRGVLHVRYRPVVRAQLGLVIHREGPMIPFHKHASGSNQVYLCFAPSAVCKGSAYQVAVAIRYAL